jgi:SOS response regulatory protein OraA/RecX
MAKNALETAVTLLKGRAKSTQTLRQALLAKGFAAAEVETALSRCAQLGYLNDEAMGQAVAKRLLEDNRAIGEVQRKLLQAGLADATVASILKWAQEECGYDELAAARFWLRQRNLEGPKAARFLASRAFTPETLERLGFGENS